MGTVEDIRKLLQDIVTPDLKALQERVTGSEKRLDAKIDVKIDALDKKVDFTRELLAAQIKNVETIMLQNHATLMRSLDVDRRLERIEREMSSEGNSKMERAS